LQRFYIKTAVLIQIINRYGIITDKDYPDTTDNNITAMDI